MVFTRSLHCHRLKWLWLKRISNQGWVFCFFFCSVHFFPFSSSACHWISCPIYCSRALKIQGEVSFNLICDCFFFTSPCCWFPCLPSIGAACHLGVCACVTGSGCGCVCVCVCPAPMSNLVAEIASLLSVIISCHIISIVIELGLEMAHTSARHQLFLLWVTEIKK